LIQADLAASLAALEPLLARQAAALRAGDAEALAPLAAALRPQLAALARVVGRGPLPAASRPRIAALSAQCEAAQTLLARRAMAVEQSLGALGAGQERAQELKLRGTYGANGAMGAGVWRSGAVERA
jgi:hypothetical protein